MCGKCIAVIVLSKKILQHTNKIAREDSSSDDCDVVIGAFLLAAVVSARAAVDVIGVDDTGLIEHMKESLEHFWDESLEVDMSVHEHTN